MIDTLLVDVGNSRVKWRFDDRRQRSGADEDGAVALADVASLRERWAAAGHPTVDRAFVSHVASEAVDAAIGRTLASMWPAIRVERVVPTPQEGDVSNGYAEPTQLGPDRWLAAIGAHAVVPNRSLLVCSFGTATTIDLLAFVRATRTARFVGGLILPGVDAMRAALARETARLGDRAGRVVAFADNTDDAIASGIVAAQIGAVARALATARTQLRDEPDVLLAGGAADTLRPFVDGAGIACRAVPDLVLRGLAVVARRYDDDRDASTRR